jgi:hypothetical protein
MGVCICTSQSGLVGWTLYGLFDGIIGRLDLLPRDHMVSAGQTRSWDGNILFHTCSLELQKKFGDSSRKSNGLERLYRSDKEVSN